MIILKKPKEHWMLGTAVATSQEHKCTVVQIVLGFIGYPTQNN